jgi:peptidoglycan/xylan/chitin deacetylase (PgdA/CDA1 family)
VTKYRIKQAIKKSVMVGASLAARCSGVPAWRRAKGKRRGLIVLMYHKVNDQVNNTLTVSPEEFRRQIAYLAGHYTVVTPDEVIEAVESEGSLPERAVLLTFDDGYLDVLSNAYPVLQKHGCRAVLFIATDFLGGRTLPHDKQVAIANPTLAWEHILMMQDVFEIGSHGCSHRIMTRMPIGEATREIRESKAIIEGRIGREVRVFSYPKGSIMDFNSELEAVVRQAGYRLCFTTIPGANPRVAEAGFNPFRLHRYNVEGFGLTYFRSLLDGSADIVGLKDTEAGYRIKQLANRLLGIENL